MNKWIRQFHRWVSMIFTLSVIATFIALSQEKPAVWVSYVPLSGTHDTQIVKRRGRPLSQNRATFASPLLAAGAKCPLART